MQSIAKLVIGIVCASFLLVGCANDGISKSDSVESAMKEAGVKNGPHESRDGAPSAPDGKAAPKTGQG